jgi:hypothetical protein
MFGDKRRSIRFKTFLNAEIRPQKNPSEFLPGVVRNFSYDGLNFISEDFNPEPKDTLKLIIKHPVRGTNIYALGDIVWNKQVNTRCYVGLKIKEMDEKLRIELLEYAFDTSEEGS